MIELPNFSNELKAHYKEELMKKMPKKLEHTKGCWSLEDTGNDSKYRCDCGTTDLNQAIDNFLQAIEEVLG
jgi:hypothetical protein